MNPQDRDKDRDKDDETGDAQHASRGRQKSGKQSGKKTTARRADGGDTASRATAGIAVAALALSVAALAVVGWDWTQGHRVETQERLDAQASRLDALTGAYEDMAAERVRSRDLSRLQERVADRLDGLSRRVAAAEDGLGRLRNDLTSGRTAFRKSQAVLLLRLAEDMLAVTGDTDAALRALRSADQALAAAGDPAMRPVRARIGEDIARLEAASDVDRQGMALSLSALERRVRDLPLAASPPDSYQAPSPEDAGDRDAPWWRRALDRAGDALQGLFTLRRVEGETRPLLAPDQAYFLRRNLELELAAARLSLIVGDGTSYRASIRQARDWAGRYFDTEQAPVQAFLEELARLEQAEVSASAPELGGARAMLEQMLARPGVPARGDDTDTEADGDDGEDG